jgi:hypothetical protein
MMIVYCGQFPRNAGYPDSVAESEADHFGNWPQLGIFGNAAHPDHIDARRRCDHLRMRNVR